MAHFGIGLKIFCANLAFFFMVYSLYFTSDYELSAWKGIGCFFLLALFCGILSIITFGNSLSPILFEWWWHDIPFWEFTTPALVISIANLVCLVIIFAGAYFEKDSI